ncbi:MAG: UvrB/UvrC motif-containing protein, partial [Chloroflexota bacterium]|nr:UvrB/UvrC motif-containing protein [Chloroflexota bacterium]
HLNGHVIMYADRVTNSMKNAIDETYRRRSIQVAYNRDNNITAESVQKSLRDIREMLVEAADSAAEEEPGYEPGFARVSELTPQEMSMRVKELEKKMRLAADALEFEHAAEYRDEISTLRQRLAALRQAAK